MSGSVPEGATALPAVDRYFDAAAGYWREVYGAAGLQGRVYRRRMEVAASWAAELGPPPPAAALDAGCGAGLMTVELARLGLGVTATDASAEMVSTTAQLVRERNLEEQVSVRQAEVSRLPFADGRFGLVVALGLLPWLEDPGAGVGELVRVLAPGAPIILTADNRFRLNRLVEPRESPLLGPLRVARRRIRLRSGWVPESAQSHRHAAGEIDALLAAAGVQVVRRTTVGYGPFTIFGHPVLSETVGNRLHDALAAGSERHPRLRGTGWHYLVAGIRRRGPSG